MHLGRINTEPGGDSARQHRLAEAEIADQEDDVSGREIRGELDPRASGLRLTVCDEGLCGHPGSDERGFHQHRSRHQVAVLAVELG